MVLAVDLANTSALNNFQFAADQVSGDASHRITGNSDSVPEALYTRLKKSLAGDRLIPVITGEVILKSEPGGSLRLLGIDVFSLLSVTLSGPADSSLKIFHDENIASAYQLINPGTVILPPDITQTDNISLLSGEKSAELKVIAQLDDTRFNGLLVADISTAQAFFQMPGKLSYIDVFIADETTDQHLIETIVQALPEGFRLERISAINDSLKELSASFRLNLTAMSLLALLVGMFLIYNTMTFAVVQRRELLGILRALGVSSNEIAIVILGEALLLGLAGTFLGSLLGIWLGTGLVHLVTRTVDDLYYPLHSTAFSISYFSLIKALALGLLVSLLAAWLPAREAMRVPPGATMSRTRLEAHWHRYVPRLNRTGLAAIALGMGILWFSQELIAGFIALFLILLGLALLTPGLLIRLVWLSRHLSIEPVTTMALRGISRHLSRTGIAVTALAVALSATVGVTIMVDSFRHGVINWLEQQLTADLYISSVNPANRSQPLQPQIIELLQTMPGISAVSAYRWLTIRLSGKPIRLSAVDLAPATQDSYLLLQGEPVTAWRDFTSNGAVMISEPLAYRHHLQTGDRLTLQTSTGSVDFTIAGVFHDYSSEHGRILMHRDTFRQFWQDDSITSMAIYAGKQQNLKKLKADIERMTASIQPLQIRANRDIFELTLAVFDRTFAITNVLRLLAVLIAFAGILSALMALQLERSREFATLRTLGMTMGQITRLTCLQTGFMGFFAGLIAIPMGLILALLLIFVINRRAFGWSLPFQINFEIFFQCIGLAITGALLASIYPLYRQRRMNLAQALRSE